MLSIFNCRNLEPHVHCYGYGLGGWTPSESESNAETSWILADLENVFLLIAVTTQGRYDTDIWTTTYSVSYGNDVSSLIAINAVYAANNDRHTKVTNKLPCNTFGRYIRLHPIGHGPPPFLGLRWDVIGILDTESESTSAGKSILGLILKE